MPTGSLHYETLGETSKELDNPVDGPGSGLQDTSLQVRVIIFYYCQGHFLKSQLCHIISFLE